MYNGSKKDKGGANHRKESIRSMYNARAINRTKGGWFRRGNSRGNQGRYFGKISEEGNSW